MTTYRLEQIKPPGDVYTLKRFLSIAYSTNIHSPDLPEQFLHLLDCIRANFRLCFDYHNFRSTDNDSIDFKLRHSAAGRGKNIDLVEVRNVIIRFPSNKHPHQVICPNMSHHLSHSFAFMIVALP